MTKSNIENFKNKNVQKLKYIGSGKINIFKTELVMIKNNIDILKIYVLEGSQKVKS